jgi:magnesium-transporting ATPase (P-type)
MKESFGDHECAVSSASTAKESVRTNAQLAVQDVLLDDDDEPPIRPSTPCPQQHQHQHHHAKQHGAQDAGVAGGDVSCLAVVEKRPFDRCPADLARDLHSSLSRGLDESLVQARLRLHGKNILKGHGKVSVWAVLWRQVSNAMTVILLGALAIAFATQDFAEGGVIAGISSLSYLLNTSIPICCIHLCAIFWRVYDLLLTSSHRRCKCRNRVLPRIPR